MDVPDVRRQQEAPGGTSRGRKAARAAGKSKAEIEKASKDPFARIFHGTLDEHRRDLRSLNEVRAGIFVTVNETDLKGRKAENVVGVRAIFAELDGPPLDEALAKLKAIGLEPHIIVQSSPDKWHLYMLADGIPLDQFTTLQKRLIKLLGQRRERPRPAARHAPADLLPPEVHPVRVPQEVVGLDLAKVFPGAHIIQSPPWPPPGASIVWLYKVHDHAPYGIEAFDGLPRIEQHEPKPKDDHHRPRPDDHDIALDCLAHINNDGRFIARADWLNIGMAVHSGTGGSFAGRMAWTAWTARRHTNAEEKCRGAWTPSTPTRSPSPH